MNSTRRSARARREQRIENLAVEDEGAKDPAGVLERVIQRRMVVDAQVAAEPDEG